MVIGSTDQNGKRHYMYRCPPVGDCPRRVTISADLAERTVWDEAVRLSQDMTGRAAIGERLEEARLDEETWTRRYSATVRMLTGMEEEEDEARAKLEELRQRCDPRTHT